MQNGGTLEHSQTIANHESPRTTKLYDRTREELTFEEVERIRISPTGTRSSVPQLISQNGASFVCRQIARLLIDRLGIPVNSENEDDLPHRILYATITRYYLE